MMNEEMRKSRILAYANALEIQTEKLKDGIPAYSTASTFRKTMEQMEDREYMISVEMGGKDAYDETV